MSDYLEKKFQEEEEEEKEPVTIEGMLIKADLPTVNGHVYSKEVLQKAVEALKGPVDLGRVIGEFGTTSMDSCVRLEDAAFIVREIGYDDEKGEVTTKVEVLRTSHGKRLLSYLRDGGSVRMTPRGLGHVGEDGVIEDDFQLVTVDIYPNHEDD